jgi:DNA-binding winged helix-turn-helix (wHTH) protein/predicted ATPase
MPPTNQILVFPPFRLDPAEQSLCRGAQRIPLPPKEFAILHHLATHAGQLVTTTELLHAAWPGTTLSRGVLKTRIHQIRRALADHAGSPQFIAVVPRRGYRFIAPVTTVTSPPSDFGSHASSSTGEANQTPRRTWNGKDELPLVGREPEWTQLQHWLTKAMNGERQVVFVTGEAGIGKTTLVEAFLRHGARHGNVWIGRGHSIEHYGKGEAYLSILEALDRLCRGPRRAVLLPILKQYAPTWLLQLPWLVSETEHKDLQLKTQDATRERMLREAALALEALTSAEAGQDSPTLVLWLDDLHWSDHSTVELLSFLAQRHEAARLLLIGAYRSETVHANDHPVLTMKQELDVHGWCHELALQGLDEQAVTQYLKERFPEEARDNPFFLEIGRRIYQSTEGHPLFMVNVVNLLVSHQARTLERTSHELALASSPEVPPLGALKSLQRLIEPQLSRLRPEQQHALEVASVVGLEFSAAAVAAGLRESPIRSEELCAELARHGQFIRAEDLETWPDGTVTGHYRFLHSLYQYACYHRTPEGWRVQLHRQIGGRKEAAYGGRASEIATEFAMHFERGHDYDKAVHYHREAAQTAFGRYAHREAATHLTAALEALKVSPRTQEQARQELVLQTTLGLALMATKGFSAPEVETAYNRVRELCQQAENASQLFSAVWGLWNFALVQGEVETVRSLAVELLDLAQRQGDPITLVVAHFASGDGEWRIGNWPLAHHYFETGYRSYNPQDSQTLSIRYGLDVGAWCAVSASATLWFLGYPATAIRNMESAVTLARGVAPSYDVASALHSQCCLQQSCGKETEASETAAALLALANEQGLALWTAVGTIDYGWLLAQQDRAEEGIALIHQGLESYRALGLKISQPYWLFLLADACHRGEQTEAGLAALAEAFTLVNATGEQWIAAELYRLKGELLLKQSVASDL